MDDIIIHAETAEQCLEKMKLVFNTAGAFGLKIKWRKCHFLQKIYFLGHNIEVGDVWPGQEKTAAVSKFSMPKNVRAVQAFLGLTGFFRKFVLNYSQISRPLTGIKKCIVSFKRHLNYPSIDAKVNKK